MTTTLTKVDTTAARSPMKTRSGKRIDFLNPDPSQIVLEDIAFSLAYTNRFNGHVGLYSVAEHSVLCAIEAQLRGHDKEIQRLALMHDAAEAYVGDIVRPLKILCPTVREIEGIVHNAIADRFDLKPMCEAVRSIDNSLLAVEIAKLRLDEEVPDADPVHPYIASCIVPTWSAQNARHSFLAHANRLGIR
ncbi:MAG: phosphohydrolase [Myxococcota bacterium]